MTYLLGWKTRENVYIAADSAITSVEREVDNRSSFGELQISERGVSVAERAMKIIVDGDLAIGLCGDFARARELAASVFRSYQRIPDIDGALREMVISTGPFPMDRTVQLVVAWRGSPAPRAFAFNHDRNGTLKELGIGEGVPLGSVRPMHKHMTHGVLARLFPLEAQGSAPYLAAALGVLQSLGVHDYLLTDGVGGSFTGLCVTREAIRWQPDLLYLIDEPGNSIWPGIATCVRDQSLIVTSTLTNQARVFATTTNQTYDVKAWIDRWGEFTQQYIRAAAFDFVVLLGVQEWVVVVLEMKRQPRSRMLKFELPNVGKGMVSWFELDTGMVDALRRKFAKQRESDVRDFRFGFQPYEPPR